MDVTREKNIFEPHHDGSPLYVSDNAPVIGQRVQLRVWVPEGYLVDEIYLRIYQDGEARTFALTGHGQWWGIEIPVVNQSNSYRFLLVHGTTHSWLTAAGVRSFEPNSNTDFVLLATPSYAPWISRSVFYQIFPDRFASSGKKRELPEWAIARSWNELPQGSGPHVSQEYFGGDFKGAESKLEYLNELGVTGLYFTPIFPARSTHRYDAISFDHVDPLLGGDKEFLHFLKGAKSLGLKVMTDLTTNHVGVGHSWFQKARRSKSAKERKFFYWDKRIEFGYVGWFGLASLPKLNFSSQELRKRLYLSKKSPFQKWLLPPYSLAGWRIDVGNMTGRNAEQDLHDEVVHELRQTFDEVAPTGWLVAENADMLPVDLNGFGWQGTMNYQGFTRPLWAWINENADVRSGGQGFAGSMPKIATADFIATLREFNGGIPWRSLLASMNLLDSHDTARMRNIVGGGRELHTAAMAMLLTYPGVPSIFAGDEIGIQGAWGEDARRTMPWDSPESWDHEFLATTQELIAIRKSHESLAIGGLRFLEIGEDHFSYLRELAEERIIVLIARKPIATIEGSAAPATPKDFGYEESKVIFSATHAQIWLIS
jgi:alpha-glucosidase